MLEYIFRGIATAITVIYTLSILGLSYGSIPTTESDMTFNAAGDISKQNEKATIYILQNREEISFELQQALNLYNDGLGDSVQFSVHTVNGEPDYRSTLRSMLLSGADVDLFQISGAREAIELQKHLRDLTPLLPWITQAHANTLDSVSFDYQLYGVPYSIEGVGLICNTNIFEEAGISFTDLHSLEDLTSAFADLKNAIDRGDFKESYESLEAVTEFSAYDKSFLEGIFADVAMSGAFESTVNAALSQTLTLPAAEDAEELIKLMARYSVHSASWPKLAEVSDAQQIERFANEKVAVILHDTNVYKRVTALNGKMQGSTALLPLPVELYEQPNIYASAPAYWSVNANSDSEAADTVCGFLTWLYQTPEGAEILAHDFNLVSPYRNAAVSTGVALHNQMLRYLDADMFLPRFHAEAPRGWGKDVFAPQVQSYFTSREKTWDEVISQSISGWNNEPAQ